MGSKAEKPRILSICTGAGVLDRAFMDQGCEVVAGCEIDPEMRAMYEQLCRSKHLCHDIEDLPDIIRGEHWDGVIGGPPCQAHTKLRAMRRPKFADLTHAAEEVLEAAGPAAFLLENVKPVRLSRPHQTALLNAMHYAHPHQSRARWFTFSENMEAPKPLFSGTVDSLMAYSVVAGRIYGPKRGAVLQGIPGFAEMPFPCVQLQKGLANAVHYSLARYWAVQMMAAIDREGSAVRE